MPAIISLLFGLGSTLFNWIASFAGSIVGRITLEGTKFIAYRSLILFLLAVVLPVLVYNIVTDIIISLLDTGLSLSSYYSSQLNGGLQLTLSFTSLGGWIAQNIYLPQAVSIYLSAISIRFIMHLIPFL